MQINEIYLKLINYTILFLIQIRASHKTLSDGELTNTARLTRYCRNLAERFEIEACRAGFMPRHFLNEVVQQ